MRRGFLSAPCVLAAVLGGAALLLVSCGGREAPEIPPQARWRVEPRIVRPAHLSAKECVRLESVEMPEVVWLGEARAADSNDPTLAVVIDSEGNVMFGDRPVPMETWGAFRGLHELMRWWVRTAPHPRATVLDKHPSRIELYVDRRAPFSRVQSVIAFLAAPPHRVHDVHLAVFRTNRQAGLAFLRARVTGLRGRARQRLAIASSGQDWHEHQRWTYWYRYVVSLPYGSDSPDWGPETILRDFRMSQESLEFARRELPWPPAFSSQSWIREANRFWVETQVALSRASAITSAYLILGEYVPFVESDWPRTRDGTIFSEVRHEGPPVRTWAMPAGIVFGAVDHLRFAHSQTIAVPLINNMCELRLSPRTVRPPPPVLPIEVAVLAILLCGVVLVMVLKAHAEPRAARSGGRLRRRGVGPGGRREPTQ